jgi:serine/threonine-protein kinase
MIALVAASLVAAIAFTAQLAVERDRARAAEAKAQQEAATSREVLAFVTGLFGELDPDQGGHADITALELVDRGRARLDRFHASSPQARAALLLTLGEIYRSGERAQVALELLTAAHDEMSRTEADTLELARVEIAIAEAWNMLVDGPQAREWITRALARIEARPDPDPGLLAKALMTSGVTLHRLGRSAEAMATFERAQSLYTGLGEAGREGLASVLHNRGWVAGGLGDREASYDWYRRAVVAKTTLLGADHPSTLNSRLAEAIAVAGLERYADAEKLLLAVLPDAIRRVGEKSGYVARAWNELGSVRQDLGHYADAAEAYRRSIAVSDAGGDGAPSTLLAQTTNNLATLDEERGDLAAAEAGYRRSLAWRLQSLDADSLPVARARHNLARVLLRQGRAEEAADLVAAARRVRDTALPVGAAERLATQALVVELELARGAMSNATSEAETLAAALAAVTQPLPVRIAAAVHRALARVAAARGEPAAAQAAFEAAVTSLSATMPADHPVLALAELDLADAIAVSDPARARTLRIRAASILDAALAPQAPDRRRLAAPSA